MAHWYAMAVKAVLVVLKGQLLQGDGGAIIAPILNELHSKTNVVMISFISFAVIESIEMEDCHAHGQGHQVG